MDSALDGNWGRPVDIKCGWQLLFLQLRNFECNWKIWNMEVSLGYFKEISRCWQHVTIFALKVGKRMPSVSHSFPVKPPAVQLQRSHSPQTSPMSEPEPGLTFYTSPDHAAAANYVFQRFTRTPTQQTTQFNITYVKYAGTAQPWQLSLQCQIRHE